MITKTVTKGTLIVKVAISFVAVMLGFAILQTVLGLFWESERLGWNLVPISLLVGCIYLLDFFCFTRRHPVLTLLITLGIEVGIILIMASVNESLHSSIIRFRLSPAFIIRVLYIWGIIEVAAHFGEPIRIKKQAEYMRKKMEKQSKKED